MVQVIKSVRQLISSMLQRLFYSLIRFYQYFIAPLLPKTCRFYPSCSEYGLAAIEHYGAVLGAWKTLHRVLRCHPWSTGGYDPILPKKEKQ